MKEEENVGDYFSRVMDNVGQQRSYGEDLPDNKVVEKVLRSLSPKFDYVIPFIEVVYETTTITPVKLMGLLQSHEERISCRSALGSPIKTGEEQTLQVYQEQSSVRGRGRGRLSFLGRGNGHGRGTLDRSKVPQCYCCKKYGNLKKDCWYNDENQANVAESDEKEEAQETEEQHLLMTFTEDHSS
jgi:hypothetical protein